MKLRAKERCPLHGRRDCCGRAEFNRYQQPKHVRKGIWTPVRPGLWRSADGREKCSAGELRRRKNELIRTLPFCIACGEKFTDYDQIELAHSRSKGIGGATRDDSLKNLALMHRDENREQGSRDLTTYLADPNRIALRRLAQC